MRKNEKSPTEKSIVEVVQRIGIIFCKSSGINLFKTGIMKRKVTDYRSKVAKDAQQMLEKGVQKISAAEKKQQKEKSRSAPDPTLQKPAS